MLCLDKQVVPLQRPEASSTLAFVTVCHVEANELDALVKRSHEKTFILFARQKFRCLGLEGVNPIELL